MFKANLLVISFDQWRGDWGDPWSPIIPLPGLQKVALEGWTAQRCYTSSPHCVPSRLSWLTGLEPSQMGITENQAIDIPNDAPSIIRNLREKGWFTALIGKTHWTSHAVVRDLRDNNKLMRSLGLDFVNEVAGPRALQRIECNLTDEWKKANVYFKQMQDLKNRYGAGHNPNAWAVRPSILPNSLYPDIWIAEQGLKQLRNMPDNKPWMLWVSFVGPHEPFDTPRPWHGRNKSSDLPPPKPKPRWIDELKNESELRKLSKKWNDSLSDESIAACRADYADHICLLDEQVQRLTQCIEQRDDGVNTAILITSDHGELLGDAEMLYKGSFLEGAVRVPWIYQPPKKAKDMKKIAERFTRPICLTGLLNQAFEGLSEDGSSERLKNWANQQPGAIVEFVNERLFVQGNRKLVVDMHGYPLWATHIGRDSQEEINILRSKPINWRFSLKWKKIRAWAKTETLKRSGKEWMWRNLNSQ